MPISRPWQRGRITAITAVTACAIAAFPAAAAPATAAAVPARTGGHIDHVLLLSIDGMHQSDLAWFVRTHRSSALAALAGGSVQYTGAQTTFPSDSFPGMVAQLTGAGPGASGVYYDDTYNHELFAPGTVDCATADKGTEVSWTEALDRSQNPIALDAGQHLPAPALTALTTDTKEQTLAASTALTAAILQVTPNPQALIDPAALPVDPATCLPLYPHQYLRVNTVFDVARQHGLRTAWSDKHPAYEILSGPSGTGLQDLFTPEINSTADAAGDDWTSDNALTQEYDGFKVAAIVNEINGFDHSGSRHVGTPAIFGMNFQTVSTAEKLPISDGLTGGYTTAGTPGPLLTHALDFIDGQVAALQAALHQAGHDRDTAIILSAKHGQSPTDLAALRRVDDGAIIDAVNGAWATAHPNAAPLVTFSVDDDGMLLWLSDRSDAAQRFVRTYLLGHTAPANVATDPKGVHSATVASSGLTRVYTGNAVDALFGAPAGDSHAPDIVGIAQYGVVYTGGVKKIAEHGGDSPADRHVPLLVDIPGLTHPFTVSSTVQTTQIAPTILALLHLNPRDLTAVRRDGTAVLPGI